MKGRQTKYYEKLLLERMRKLLSHMAGHSREVLDLEGAQEYVCSVCDLPLKPCAAHPGRLCCVALKGGSELFELEAAMDRIRNDEYGLCSLCGKEIPREYLKSHPTAVFCDHCLRVLSREERRARHENRSRKNLAM